MNHDDSNRNDGRDGRRLQLQLHRENDQHRPRVPRARPDTLFDKRPRPGAHLQPDLDPPRRPQPTFFVPRLGHA